MLTRRPSRDRRAGFGGTHKADPIDERVPSHLIAHLGAGPGHQVGHAGRKIGFRDALHQRDGDHARR